MQCADREDSVIAFGQRMRHSVGENAIHVVRITIPGDFDHHRRPINGVDLLDMLSQTRRE
jgi:hypothetical protein